MYTFKFTPELAWFVAISVLTPLFAALATVDVDTLTEWQPWAVGVGAAMVRALGGALLSVIAPKE